MGSGTTATTSNFVPGGNYFPVEHVRALLDTVEKESWSQAATVAY